MEKIVNFEHAEVATEDDFDRLGLYARESLDHVVGDAIGYPAGWVGFAPSLVNTGELELGEGRYWRGDKVYGHPGGLRVPLSAYQPAQSGISRWIGLVLRGQDSTLNEVRQFETDADSDELVSQSVVTTYVRFADVVVLAGTEAVTALKPAPTVDQAVVIYARLTSTGIAELERYEAHRVKGLGEVEVRVQLVERALIEQGLTLATHKTDISNLSQAITGLPRPEIFRQTQKDVATLRRISGLPAEARAAWYDNFLVPDQADTSHPLWLARIDEGVRYANASVREVDFALQDADDAAIVVVNGILMPAYDEVARIVCDGTGGELSISEVTQTVTTLVKRSVTRTRVKYGPIFNACENRSEWAALADRRAGEVFKRDGETFEAVGLTDHVNNSDPVLSQDHKEYAVRSVTYDRRTTVYWDEVSTQEGLNGSIRAQSFLNAQPGIMTSIDLKFTRTDPSASIKLIVMECDITDAPSLRRTIDVVTVPGNTLGVGWNRIPIQPSPGEAGRKLAWAVVTNGNYWLATTNKNNFAQGSSFLTTDGGYFVGSTEVDLCFRVNFAKFRANRVVVPFEPMYLENGMAGFSALYAGWEPSGTRAQIEFNTANTGPYVPVANYELEPLSGLPAIVRWNIVLSGTSDLMPMINLDDATITTVRPRGDMRFISEPWMFGVSSDLITVEVEFDAYDPAIHTSGVKLLVADAQVGPLSTTVIPHPTDPAKRTLSAFFDLAAAVTSVRIIIESDSDSVVAPPFVQRAYAHVL